MKRLFIALALVLFWATPAAADTEKWVTFPGGSVPCTLSDHRECFWDATTTGATALLMDAGCENLSLKYVANIASGAHANTVTLWDSLANTIDATDDTAEAICQTAITAWDGDAAANRFACYGLDISVGFYARFTISAGTARLAVECFPR